MILISLPLIKPSPGMELTLTHTFALLLSLCVCLSAASSQPQGKSLPLLTSDVKEVAGKSFDYIIVGGGTAGCPLAATLSETFSVLLVEGGDSPFDNPLIIERSKYGFSLIQTDEYSSVAQSFTSQEGVGNVRGRVLGGSSAINGGFYSRASGDFVRRVGWEEELVEEAYEWVESRIIFKPDQLSPWQSVVESGFLEAGIEPYNGFTLEHVEGTKIGGSSFDEFGKRHTSADLLMEGNEKSMTVLVNATVKNLIFHKKNCNEGESIVRGIRFMKSNDDHDNNTEETYEAYLNQDEKSSSIGDVILTAGAIGSPQILLLSGIGPEKHLTDLNITVMVNLSFVGQGMKDNPCISILTDTPPRNQQPDPPQVVGITKDFKIIIQSLILPISLNSTRRPIVAKIAFPESKGKLELKNTDPRQNPSITFNYLQEEQDLQQCVEIYKLVQRVARSQAVTMFLGNKHELLTSEEDEDQLRKLCKENMRTYYHFHGGCLVGSVVDESYRVFGVKGLRVVDGSTFHESPGTNPMATVLMLGRYQGIKILRERRHSDASSSSPESQLGYCRA